MNLQNALARLRNVKRNGNDYTAQCPAHDDRRNSLSVSESSDGRILLHCHAGCTFEAIIGALDDQPKPHASPRIIVTYDYRDESGALLYQAVRFEPKDFRPRRPDASGGFVWTLGDVRRVLYRLPEIIASDAQTTVFIVEGEKDADRLASLGLIATTNTGGAGKWRDEYNEHLRGRNICILPDNDEPGRAHAAKVARALAQAAASVKVLELPNLPPKGDVSDYFNAGGTVETLSALVEGAPEWEHVEAKKDAPALRVQCMADVEAESVAWLWHPYIALGKLTLIEGDPGLGKSWTTCALASAVSHGRGLPGVDADSHIRASNVLMLSAEDGLADTLRPRFDAVGADLARIFAVDEPFTLDQTGLLLLEGAIIEHTPALVVIDPLFAFTGGKVDIHRANECRAISAPLATLAARYGCAFLAVRHLSKSRGQGHALNAGIGSIDFTAAARSVLLVGRDPDDEAKRAIVQTKNNLAPHGASQGYKLEGNQFFWMGESDLTSSRILSIADNEEERSALSEAVDFLRSALVGGEREVDEVKAEARRAGITDATLRRARERLNLKAIRQGAPGARQRFVWRLPHADNAQVSTDDAQTRKVEHHRTSEPSKSSYSNDLADDVQLPELEHHQANDCTSSNGSSDSLTDEEAELAAQFEYYGASREEADRTAKRMFEPVPF
jgi:hypothetical protein